MASTYFTDAARTTLSRRGGTFRADGTHVKFSDGYMVGIAPERTFTTPVCDADTLAGIIRDYVTNTGASLIGTWVYKDTIYLDVVANIADKQEALRVARTHSERAIWDARLDWEIRVQPTNEAQAALTLNPAGGLLLVAGDALRRGEAAEGLRNIRLAQRVLAEVEAMLTGEN